MLCKCGGKIDIAELTGNRERYWCRACGRYEIRNLDAARNVQCGLYSDWETKTEIQKNGEIRSDIHAQKNS